MTNQAGKGVIFDTGRSYDEYAILDMFAQNRLMGFGSAKHYVRYIYSGDLVFFSHKWCGLVAAARVTSPLYQAEDQIWYHEVAFLTKKPTVRDHIPFMPQDKMVTFLGRRLYSGRIKKVPYLNATEAMGLLAELENYL